MKIKAMKSFEEIVENAQNSVNIEERKAKLKEVLKKEYNLCLRNSEYIREEMEDSILKFVNNDNYNPDDLSISMMLYGYNQGTSLCNEIANYYYLLFGEKLQ